MDIVKRRRTGLVVALGVIVLALPVGVGLGQTLSGDTDDPSAAADQAQQQADSREGLTKLRSAMIYNGAPAEQIADIDGRLEAFGGPDPAVAPVDGPDNAEEWQLQVEADEHGCKTGDQDACDRLPESKAALEEAR
jgi:hypothetical protein